MTVADDILQGIRSWLKTANSLTDEQCIKADGKGPRPDLPYLAVKVQVSDLNLGPDATADLDDGGGGVEHRVRGERAATVEVQGYSPSGTTTARQWIQDALVRLTSPAVASVLSVAGLVVVTTGADVDVSALLDTQIEDRVSRTLEVRYTLTDSTAGAPELTTTVVDMTYTDQDPDPDPLLDTLTIPLP